MSATFCQTMLERYSADISRATQHEFLARAGRHELSKEVLSEWLGQDWIYAFVGYPKFAGQMVAHLNLEAPGARDTLALLSFALQNVVRETAFFESLGPRFGLNLAQPVTRAADGGEVQSTRMNPITKAYVDTLAATGSNGRLDEGLVLLWAMEKLYFESWTFARKHTPTPTPADKDVSAALTELIDNWTCEEFRGFVNDCTEQVDRLDLREGSDAWTRCEEVFKYTCWLEQRFWPSV